MQKYFFLFSLFTLLLVPLKAQQNPSATAASTAPGNASTAYKEQWMPFHNPAILSSEKELRVSINYQNRFQLKELSTKALSVAIPTELVDLGVAISHFGYSQYNEMQGGIGLARSFSNKFSMGIQFNYYSVFLSPSEGTKGTVVGQVGLLSEVLKGFIIGFHAYNPAQTSIKIGVSEKRIPSIFSLGTSYYFSDKLLWLAQLDKEIDFPLQWRTGFEYRMVKELSLKMGVYGNPFVPNMGVSIFAKQLQVDLNFERHPTLGVNSICGLSYTFR